MNKSSLKIALIGPGIMPIPPSGHGAVEILIWDYFLELTNQGHQVDIINIIRKTHQDQSSPYTPYCMNLINTVNSGNYDFVHLHYDCLYNILPFLTCRNLGITSHYPYIEKIEKHASDGFSPIFSGMCRMTHSGGSGGSQIHIFAISRKDMNAFIFSGGANKDCVFLLLNGANHREIKPVNYLEKTELNKSIYVAKVEERKQQHVYYKIPNIDFYGPCNNSFKTLDCYKGELSHEELIKKLVNYGNLILLSNGEADPLVVKEALMAGLPIVINKHSVNDLDTTLPFIDVIPDEKLNDLEYIQMIIEENLKKQNQQKDIRNYAITNFSWESLTKKYITNVMNICSREK